jgi:serine/threonine protein kinase
MKILHRDLKPENLLIDEKGYIKISHFGLAIDATKEVSGNVGTGGYMAPEVLEGKNYSFPADYYSVASTIHEMITSRNIHNLELEGKCVCTYELLRIQNNFLMPSFFQPGPDASDLIKRMTCENPKKRLSSLRDIKACAWFRDFDWDKILKKERVSPVKFELPHVARRSQHEKDFHNYGIFEISVQECDALPKMNDAQLNDGLPYLDASSSIENTKQPKTSENVKKNAQKGVNRRAKKFKCPDENMTVEELVKSGQYAAQKYYKSFIEKIGPQKYRCHMKKGIEYFSTNGHIKGLGQPNAHIRDKIHKIFGDFKCKCGLKFRQRAHLNNHVKFLSEKDDPKRHGIIIKVHY